METGQDMKTVIITEKPSVAMDFARALGVSGKKDGYIEQGDTTITWGVGHLVELCEPEDYNKALSKWSMSSLPIIPDPVRYKPVSKTKKQLQVIKGILSSKDIGRVVIATDAGREGEVIARTILNSCGFKDKSKIFRFWTSQALTTSVVQAGMKALKPATEYDRLWNAGQSRQIADWLVGMNGTRAATVKMGSIFSVGRVQTAVLAMIVDRLRERRNFKPVPYFVLRSTFVNDKGTWVGTWLDKDGGVRMPDEKTAKQIHAKVNGQKGEVVSVKTDKKKQAPPLLYSLTDLQQEANRRFGFSAKMTLDIAQDLYEKRKCLSYPRTDSKVLGEKNVDLAKSLARKLATTYPKFFSGVDDKLFALSNKRVFNDAKLTDHHALVPMAPLPANASADEKKLYELVLKRFAAAFHHDCDYEQTEIMTEVKAERFRTQGKRILKPGWRAVYGSEISDINQQGDEPEQDNLPPVVKQDPATVKKADLDRKETTPPPEYTEALVLKDMTNPSRYVTEEELKKVYRGDVGLGTQATRAAIIETLLARKYVERQKKYLIATDKGCHLIDTLRGLKSAGVLASPEQTARWEMQLEEISRGAGSEKQFLDAIKAFTTQIVEEFKMSDAQAMTTSEKIGDCPKCGGAVIEGKKGFGCSNWRDDDGGCKFVIWKEMAGKKLDAKTVSQLLDGKQVGPLSGFVSSKQKPFSACLKLDKENGESKVVFVFDDSAPSNGNGKPGEKPKAIGKCPGCGGDIIEGTKGYGCSNWREQDGGCKFTIWKEISKKKLPIQVVQQLLTQGTTAQIEGFTSKAGKPFAAALKLEWDGKTARVSFDFPDQGNDRSVAP